MEESITLFIGTYGWLFITGFLMFFFKGGIENLYYGLRFMLGNEYNVDDIVYIDKKKCRIVRQSIYRTTFYVVNDNVNFHIANNSLQYYIIEKEIKI